ncbi:MAG: hypothetical protein HY360_22940 [Verrucomicrobia bacterium]|nr:hypothetical protein [Verrucomicrobiota bacterium]
MQSTSSPFFPVTYVPPGADPNQLGDITVIEHDGIIHLFHLTLPNHDVVGHAVSSDGLRWKPVEPAIHTGGARDCDGDMIWTMHVMRHPSHRLFHMYYTGCSLAESGQVQRVALATSENLFSWKKHTANPILESRSPHYNENLGRVGFISFRDPFVFTDANGLWHILVVARTAKGARFRNGCVAHATSRDGIRWQLLKPLYAPSQFEDLEVPSLLQHAGRYALFFHHFCVGDTFCRVADSLDGPWLPPRRELLLPRWNAVFRFCEWNGRTLLYHWLHSTPDWPRRGARGTGCMILPPPKEVEWDRDGAPMLKSFSGWKGCHKGRPQTLPAAGFLRHIEGSRTAWIKISDGSVRGETVGRSLAAHSASFDHFIAEFTLRVENGRAAGLVFRADPALEVANFLRLDFERRMVELHRWNLYDSSLRRYKLVQPTLFQSLPAGLQRNAPLRVRVLACGEYIEVCLDDVVHLSAATYAAKEGRFAWVTEDAGATFGSLTVQPLTPPKQTG